MSCSPFVMRLLYSFMGLTCYLCCRVVIKPRSAMPYFKTSKKNLPLSTLLDIKSQKSGPRCTVFSVNGNEYTGEWLDNKKHGEILFDVSFHETMKKLIFMRHNILWPHYSQNACLFIITTTFLQGREFRCGRNLVLFMMESGNLENVMDMVPMVCCSQNQRSM